jgi:replicative DNA helicase
MKSGLDRLPPHSIESEQALLGCLLLEPNTTLPLAMDAIERGADVFYDMRHQALFDQLVAMHDKGERIEPIIVGQWLRDRNCLEAFGGMPYIAGLMNATPSAASLEYYLEIVTEKAFYRKVIQTCGGLIEEVYASTATISELADAIESRILALRRTKARVGTRKESLLRVLEQLQDAHAGNEIPGVLKTGFRDLDSKLNGLWPGQLIIIAGRPAMGKSTLAMNIVENIATAENRVGVGYFSLEMSDDLINARSIASQGRVNLKAFARQVATESDFQKVSAACGKLIKAPIDIDYSPGITITQLRARARRMVAQGGAKMIVVDMIQLVSAPGHRGRTAEVDEVARGLKSLAGELNIPVIGVSSMNREIDKDDNRRPRLSDLRESGEIESSADVVAMLWCPDPTSEVDSTVRMSVNIPKCRSGETCELDLTFIKKFNRFEDCSPIDRDEHGEEPEHGKKSKWWKK